MKVDGGTKRARIIHYTQKNLLVYFFKDYPKANFVDYSVSRRAEFKK